VFASQLRESGLCANIGLDCGPGGNLATVDGPVPLEVFVEREVEMAVNANGIDRAGALIIECVIAAAARFLPRQCLDYALAIVATSYGVASR
jgi:hypothetical protein